MLCPKHGQFRFFSFLITIGLVSTYLAHAATNTPEVVFGPKKFFAQLVNPKPQKATFNVTNPELSPGRLIVQNGKYPPPQLEKCPKLTKTNIVAVGLCKARNSAKELEVFLTRPKNIQIELNGVVVVKESDFCPRTPILTVSVPLKATNTIKVLVKGLPTQYVVVSIDRTSIANQAPLANFSFTPGQNADPLNYNFNGSASSDPDGSITNYSWDFGDETPAASGAQVTHKYEALGTYNVVLTVTDNKGAQNSKVQQVTVQDTRAPQLNVTQPLAGAALTSRTIVIAGTSDEALSEATVNGQSLTLSSDKKQFGGSYQVSSDGAYSLTIQGKDIAGNASTVSRQGTVTTVTNLPPVAHFKYHATSRIRTLDRDV